MFEKRQGISLTIRLRTKRTKGEATLYCRLRYNGQLTIEYKLDIYVPVEAWDQKIQGLCPGHPLAESLKVKLDEIKAEHENILAYQLAQQAFLVTAETIRKQWSKKAAVPTINTSATLIDAYDYYLSYLKNLPADEKLADKTMNHYKIVRTHLVSFLKKAGHEGLFTDAVTPGWGKQFYDYLRPSMAKDTCARYVIAIRSALNHCLLYEHIKKNGLYEFKAPKAQPRKPIYFLRKEYLEMLSALPLVGTRKEVRDWALFMCHTGLDYNDARRVVDNPETYLVRGVDGDKWVYQRLKLKRVAMWGECHIPILDKAAELLPLLRKQKRRHKLRRINHYLNEFGVTMDLPFPLSSKVCRKTAGVVFMEEGYTMQSIQKILGHQSLSMTEAHYVSIQPSVVDKDTRRIRAASTTHQSFQHIYKAS